MASPAAVLSILVTANTGQAVRGIGRVNASLGATEGSSNKALGAVKTFAKGAAVATGIGLGYAVKKAADFESQLSSLGSVSGATGRQMQALRKQAMKAGADTKFSALEAAKAQTELAKGGLSVAQIMKGGLKSSLALAAAGELDLADAASTTANAMNLFGLKGKESIKVADMLATAANATTADVSDFAMALSQGGSVAKSVGLSFRETVLALEALAKSGIKNSDAGTSLKTALIQLIKPTDTQASLAKKLNLEFTTQEGKFKSLGAVSTMLRARLGDMTKAQRTAALATLAGTDGVRTLTALYDAGAPRLAKWSKGLDKTGTAAEVAAKKQDNFKGKLENLKGSIETAAIAIGSRMLPALTRAAEQVTAIINDPNLTGAEKFTRLANMAGEAFRKAIPIIADAMAKAAPVAALSFVKGFMAAGVWGRLLVTGWLLTKMGGPAAFAKLGATAGVATGNGMATGVAASGLKGKMVTLFRGWGPTLAIALAASFGPELVKKLKDNGKALTTGAETSGGAVKRAQEMIKAAGSIDEAQAKLRAFEGDFRRVANMPGKADNWRQYYGGIADAIASVRAPLDVTARKAKETSDRFAQAIRGLKLKSSADFDGLVRSVVSGSKNILRVGGEKSKQTQQEVSRQFGIARDRVRDSMRNQIISVREGASRLHELAVKELKLYGISAGRVSVVLAKGAGGQMRPNQRGGYQMGGRPSGDSIPSLLERGEYVVNRKAVSKVGRHALDKLNFGDVPRFQRGGMAGMTAAANRLESAHFPYVWGGGHQGSPAPFGPMDCSGAVSYVLQQGGVKIPTMVSGALASAGKAGPGAVTVFANPEHTFMRIGKRFFGTSGTNPGGGAGWFPDPGGAYLSKFTQRHFNAGGLGQIARVLLSGPPSVALEAGQGALDRVRSGANAAINRLATTPIGAGDAGDPGAGMYGKRALKQLWVRAGGSPARANLMAAIAMAESHGNPGAANGPYHGLWQVGPGGSFDPFTNARQAVGKLNSQGLSAWEAYTNGSYTRFLRKGGKVPGIGSGDRVPAMLEPGEFVIRKRIVDQLGPTFFNDLNGMKKGGRVKHPISAAHKRAAERFGTSQAGTQNRQAAALRAARNARQRRNIDPMAWDHNIQAWINIFESQLALAELTPDKADDLAALNALQSLNEKGLRRAQRLGDIAKVTDYAHGVSGVRDQISGINDVGAGTGEDPNQPLIDAISANTQAQIDHKASVDAGVAEAKRMTDLALKWGQTSDYVKTKYIADFISGHLGRGIVGRGRTPGTGVEVAYAMSIFQIV